MSSIGIDPYEARSTAATFESNQFAIEDSLNTMMSSVSRLLSTWNGQSRMRFESEWEQWVQRLRAMMDELQSLANGLRREADEFEESARSFG
ncbi:MAG: WXG100 family type VII secretion target [Chloroflexi bacterium]|jgi:WXG100 family type VII secretion target|nr:MAG: WXG100 family type VII secretion target [Chloroflexota bacterium]